MAHDINDRTSVRTLTRRQFLTWISVALGGVGSALVGIPVISFLLAPLFEKPRQSWRPVGEPAPAGTPPRREPGLTQSAWAG